MIAGVVRTRCITLPPAGPKRERWFTEAEVQRSDHAHASRMHQQFGVTWGDPLLYDLILGWKR